jgi:hypothetical protein
MACSREITVVMLYDLTIQFHVASLASVMSDPVSWSLMCASTVSRMTWVIRRNFSSSMATALSTSGM